MEGREINLTKPHSSAGNVYMHKLPLFWEVICGFSTAQTQSWDPPLITDKL